MDRRNFMKATALTTMCLIGASKVSTASPVNKDVILLNARNTSQEISCISLPEQNVTEMTDDFLHDMTSESIVEVEVISNGKKKELRLDATKEDFTITFPDGTTWKSSGKIKENV